jgi:hypothetical protein
MFLLFVGAAYLVGPDMYSRILCARTPPPVARRSLIATAAVLIPAAFASPHGDGARVLLPGIPPESAFPALVMKVVPPGLNASSSPPPGGGHVLPPTPAFSRREPSYTADILPAPVREGVWRNGPCFASPISVAVQGSSPSFSP